MTEEKNVNEIEKYELHVKKLQKKVLLTAGYICMFSLFWYFFATSSLGSFFSEHFVQHYTERSFSNVVNQLNQLSRDAEKASGS